MALSAISTVVRDAVCDAFVDQFENGATDTGGDFLWYTSAYATLLGTNECSATAFGASSTGVATANAISDDTSADATGTADVGRCQDQGNTALFDFDINTSGADLNVNTLSITSGDTLSISSATITMPAS